jgi:predicted transcriptional regulator
MNVAEVLTGSVSPAAIEPNAKKKPRTAAATKARKKAYDKAVRLIVKPLKEIRACGFKSAEALAEMLNAEGVAAPNEIIWTKSSVLRALRRLRELGLEPKKEQPGYVGGPYHPLDLNKPADLKLYLQAVQQAKQADEQKKAALADEIFNSL